MAKSKSSSFFLNKNLIIFLLIFLPILGFIFGNLYAKLIAKSQSTTSDINSWNLVRFDECNASFKVPPKEEPYYYPKSEDWSGSHEDIGSGRFWDIPRGAIGPTVLYLLSANPESISQMNAWFSFPEEASGYVSAAVSLSCIDNSSNLDNSALLEMIKVEINEYNAKKEAVGMMPENYTLGEVAEVTLWDKSVLVVTLNDDKYYVFTTPDKIYEITKIVSSSEEIVKQTAEDILNNLTID